MAEPHVVSALREKRDELAGLVAKMERELVAHRDALGHVDATLRLFAPELTPDTIRPKRIQNRDGMFQNGELPRRVLDTLRRAAGPMHITDIARAIMPVKGLKPTDAAALDDMVVRVGKSLNRLRLKGLARNGFDSAGLWALSE
jgi:hypothetical protein